MGSGASKQELLEDAPKVTVYDASLKGVRPHQEDRHVALKALSEQHEEMAYFAVFDGHNGTAAADFCAEHLHERVAERVRDGELPPRGLKAAFVAVDDAFLMSGQGKTRESGCTAAVAVLNRLTGRLVVGNAGDARCVLSRGGVARALTEDHKPSAPGERARIEAAGRQVRNNRLDGVLAVSRAIGDLSMKLELVKDGSVTDPERFALSPVPDTQEVVLGEKDEFLLLACDGLFDVVSNQEAVDWVRERLPISRLRAPPPHVLHAEAAEAGAGNEEEVDEDDPAAVARAVMARLAAAGGDAGDDEAPARQEVPAAAAEATTRAAEDEGPSAEELAAIRSARATMRSRRGALELATGLAQHALDKGSTDNVSVVVVLFDRPAPRAAPSSPLQSRMC